GHHEIADGERGGRCAVVLAPVRHLNIPDEQACRAIQRDQVSVVSDHEKLVAAQSHTAIDSACGVAGQTSGPWTLVAPDLTAVTGVECVAFVRLSDIHHAVGHYGSALQAAGIRHSE